MKLDVFIITVAATRSASGLLVHLLLVPDGFLPGGMKLLPAASAAGVFGPGG